LPPAEKPACEAPSGVVHIGARRRHARYVRRWAQFRKSNVHFNNEPGRRDQLAELYGGKRAASRRIHAPVLHRSPTSTGPEATAPCAVSEAANKADSAHRGTNTLSTWHAASRDGS
jgi:hypothetical protein